MTAAPLKQPDDATTVRVWWICGILLAASAINYLDRQTLAGTSEQIIREFSLSKEQYGRLELAFGLAFAVGAVIFGVVADRTNVRWLYPAVLLLWSATGFLTGLVNTYAGLLACRFFLGLFEAGHWPCALKTTRRLLPPSKRTLGNSVLQSGTAIGAIAAPQVIKWMTNDQTVGGWRPAFLVVGAVGTIWIVFWLLSVRTSDLQPSAEEEATKAFADDDATPFGRHLLSRRFWILVIVVVAINLCWHQFRVWMMLFLQEGRGYARNDALDVFTWFNIATDVGCLLAGAATAAQVRRGVSVHAARHFVFGCCALLVAAGAVTPWLPKGRGLELMLLVVGFGALGLFPCYYSLTQDLSAKHLGKITGTLGAIAWVVPAVWHPTFGRWIDTTKSYDLGMIIAALLPLVGWVAILAWPKSAQDEP